MTHQYTSLDDRSLKTLTFSINQISRNTNSTRIKSLPASLISIIEDHHKENFKKYTFEPYDLYNTYLRSMRKDDGTDLSTLFPSMHQAIYRATSPDAYLDKLRSSNTTNYDRSYFNELAPIAVRYTNGTNLWLIERPPFEATITYKATRSSSDGKTKEYKIWMPWTVMLVETVPENSYFNASLFFNDGPITSLDDLAIPCMFPNMYGDGHMCLNQTSTMLQQHLAANNSYDIATIYNFLINDYMSGGWNTDLGIQVFDSYRNFGDLIKNVYKTITRGIDGDKRFTPSFSPITGRVSFKKYIANFLNYFSHAPMGELMNIITEVKQHISDSSNHGYQSRAKTFNQIIKSNEDKNQDFDSLFTIPNVIIPLVHYEYNVLVDPYFLSKIIDNNTQQTVADTIINLIESSIQPELYSVYCSDDKMHTKFFQENDTIYIKDESTAFFLNTSSTREYFEDLLQINQQVLQ
jgi:hypothetical protein